MAEIPSKVVIVAGVGSFCARQSAEQTLQETPAAFETAATESWCHRWRQTLNLFYSRVRKKNKSENK